MTHSTEWQALQSWLDELDDEYEANDIPDIDDSLSAAEGVFNGLWLGGLLWCGIVLVWVYA